MFFLCHRETEYRALLEVDDVYSDSDESLSDDGSPPLDILNPCKATRELFFNVLGMKMRKLLQMYDSNSYRGLVSPGIHKKIWLCRFFVASELRASEVAPFIVPLVN